MPDGSTLEGRWHAPGSGNGWLLVETDQPGTLYLHAAEWGDFVTWQITPVFTDEQAAGLSVEGRGRRPDTTPTLAKRKQPSSLRQRAANGREGGAVLFLSRPFYRN